MRIFLAPMEGVADNILRDVLTRVGGVDVCVSEFIRVSASVLPSRFFYRVVPELRQGGKTRAGVPVRVQLLGSDPHYLVANAAKAVRLGAPAIDLNFGCPAPIVNRHCGGAILLENPEALYQIVRAVRAAVPAKTPVTAKMRLGYHDTQKTLACAQALADGGADEIAVHARTKAEGYRPPAHWEWIGAIREVVQIPVIANGEIWQPSDWQTCQQASGAQDVMLGRGLVARPDLALALRAYANHDSHFSTWTWAQILPLLMDFYQQVQQVVHPKHVAGRLKQWLKYLTRHYVQATTLLAAIRTETHPQKVADALYLH